MIREKKQPPFQYKFKPKLLVCTPVPRPPLCIYTPFTKSGMVPLCCTELWPGCPLLWQSRSGRGTGRVNPCHPLGSFTAECEGVLGVRGGAGQWVLAGATRVPSRVVDVKPQNLPALPGRTGPSQSLRTSLVLPFLCKEGGGCCLWRFSMVLLNQADRFWLLLSLCWFSFLFFSFFSH